VELMETPLKIISMKAHNDHIASIIGSGINGNKAFFSFFVVVVLLSLLLLEVELMET